MQSLNNQSSSQAPVVKPTYDRSTVTTGVVHIGVGGFHRAHQAVYFDDLLQHKDARHWGICGVGIRAADAAMAQALLPQDCLFTVIERHGNERNARIVGSHTNFLLGTSQFAQVIDTLAAESTHLVTLTVTEGGYYCDEATGALRLSHPDIVFDIEHFSSNDVPRTVYGYLVKALLRRQELKRPPVTLLSCDNVQQNGTLLANALRAFAQACAPKLLPYLDSHVSFPCSMVDRITPMTTDADRRDAETMLGLHDAWPVSTEPFKQWVVEDKFAGQRPPLERVGVQFTHEVEPYERIKLRLLNAGHSALGYLGYLCGFRTIDQIAADKSFQTFLTALWREEVTALLPPVPGVEVQAYQRTLVQRFCNAAIGDQAKRICMDGSAKMPKFILPSIREQLEQNGKFERLALVVAGWIYYLQGKDEAGEAIVIEDPMAQELQALAQQCGSDPRHFLSHQGIFGADLSASPVLYASVAQALQSLQTRGVRATVDAYAVI